MVQAAFHLKGQPHVDLLASSHTNQCQYSYTLESPLPLAALALNAFNYPQTYQVSYVFPSPALVPLVLSGRTCPMSIRTFYSSGTLLDGGSLASNGCQHVSRHLSSVPHCKIPHHGCVGWLVA